MFMKLRIYKCILYQSNSDKTLKVIDSYMYGRHLKNGEYELPLNGQVYLAPLTGVIYKFPRLKVNQEQAEEHNTCLFTCRNCGGWLKPTDNGYGTMEGVHGCR